MSSSSLLRCSIAVALTILAADVEAHKCPGAGATLIAVRNAVNDMGKSDRIPAAAKCAQKWASGIELNEQALSDPILINYFVEAADLHRRAYDIRQSMGEAGEAESYLQGEIVLRKRFLEAALRSPDGPAEGPLRIAVVKHLSALSGALARRQAYAEIDNVLANTPPTVIDAEAVNVWLLAIWSCAKFDGQTANLCSTENRDKCREKISGFLASLGEMKGRKLMRQTERDVERLRRLTAKGGCLQ